ncbi:MAG: hypothetical protein L3J39_03225 [Verrucomicrobiales bacterium]|nr:hypothetical protein [Verrucomicrobiales bacterium]
MRKLVKWAELKEIAVASVAAVTMAMMMSLSLAAPGNLQQVFNTAKAAYDAGRYEEAAAGFRKVLKHQPGYVYARKYLRQTEIQMKKGKVAVSLEGKLAKLNVPNVEFDKASLATVMEYLTAKSSEISGGKVVANFIYKGSNEDKESKTVTLKLGNVPMTEVIRYVGQLTGTKFKYEEYAVVGIPAAQDAGAKKSLEQKVKESSKPQFDDAPKDPFAKK